MKKYSIFALALVMGAMTLTSCEDAFGNFLDKQPSNELTKVEVLGNFTCWNRTTTILTTSCFTVPTA